MLQASQEASKPNEEPKSLENNMSCRLEPLTIQEGVKEGETEDDEGLPTYPYERLIVGSDDPVAEIDVTEREVYFSYLF